MQEILSSLKDKLPSPPQVVIERSLARDIDELVAGVWPPVKLAVVDDGNTGPVFGQRVFRALKGRFASTHVTFPQPPEANEENAEYLRMQTLSCDALVAVGTGTINDLCKYVAHQSRKPYIVFPTAASMNGYLSANASISRDGYKKTVPAQMPQAVFCDLSIIAAAPSRLSRSGLGDCLARPTAQADWLLSHLLLGTAYDETPFDLLRPLEPQLFERARGIALGDVSSMEALMKTLLLSGAGMTIAGGSYPASQGEHMIAHAMEMTGKAGDTFHGEQIAVTALTMAAMQEKLLRAKPRLRADDFNGEAMIETFGSRIAAEARKAFEAKRKLMSALSHRERGGASRGEGIAGKSPHPVPPRQARGHHPLPRGEGISDWDAIAEKIERIFIAPKKLEAILKQAKAPTIPADLEWPDKHYKVAVESARYLRERFTFLDVE